MIPRDTIQSIIDAARIDEVVGDFVQLKKRGVNLLGLCPFHNERTPSFTVSPAKGIFKCFGCGKAGNSVNFIMEHEKYSYPEALRYLANKYTIEIEEQEPTPEEKQLDTDRDSLFALNSFAQKFYTQTLSQTEEGRAIGLSYFIERGFREDIIEKFQLGFSPTAWDAFTQHALKHGYSEKYLVESGLTISKEGKLYDRFRERVMFPIHNLTGKVIGFGGRILTSDKTKPKYVNSPESEVYNKSKSLYGIWLARGAIVARDNCYLVEGYTDVISLHQSGIENVVASSGTSLTNDQIKLINKYTRNITILYDGDPAGIKASFRGIDMILEQGMNVKIVLFPDGEDPDSYARKNRSADVEAFIASQSDDFIAFKTRLLLGETNNDPIKKAGLIHEIIQSISLIPDGIIRPLYIRQCAEIMGLAEQTLMNELNRVLRKKRLKGAQDESVNEEVQDQQLVAPPQEQVLDITDCSAQELDVIRVLLLYGEEIMSIPKLSSDLDNNENIEIEVAKFICNDLRANQISFDNKVFNSIFQIYSEYVDDNSFPGDAFFLLNENVEIAEVSISIVTVKYELSDGWGMKKITIPLEKSKIENSAIKSVLTLMQRKLTILVLSEKNKLKNPSLGDEERITLTKHIIFVESARNEISRRLGRTLNN